MKGYLQCFAFVLSSFSLSGEYENSRLSSCRCPTSEHLDMIFHGKYEDFLEYNQQWSEKIVWEDFFSFQKKIKKIISADKSIDSSLYYNFIACLFSYFNQNKEAIVYQNPQVLFPIVFKEKRFQNEQRFKILFRLFLELIKADFFISLSLEKADLLPLFLELNELNLNELDLLFVLYTYWILQNQYENPNVIFKQKTQVELEKFKDLFFEDTVDAKKIFREYLIFRSKLLDLDLKSPFNEVVTKISSCLGLFKKEESQALKEALIQLNPDDLALVVEEFSRKKVDATISFSEVLIDFIQEAKNEPYFG
ncbi:MAG: hypothetical protein EBU93_00910, partial [Chlamydiae bacterium]|nr:hypothetical protein [Chlamydiota bacterium]